MKTKKIFSILALVLFIGVIAFSIIALSRQKTSAKIIATNFVSYDFARAILGDSSEVKMLLKPATDIHSYEPTPQDIIDITNADFIIYVGGESDEWIAKIISDNHIDSSKTIRMMDFVSLKKEQQKEGMEAEVEEDDDEYDEHIWTSPLNAISILESMRDRFVAKKPMMLEKYTKNTADYVAKLQDIDHRSRDIVSSAKRKELIFADRFPFRYFVDEYGLDYYAAFPGCSEQTEASSATVAFLVRKVRDDNIPVVLKIELSSSSLAETISNETGAKILTLNAAHNISQADYEAGKTYADILTDNIAVLTEALN